MKLVKWIGGILEDQAGSASSKRVCLFIFCYFFWMQIRGGLEGKVVNESILYATIIIILFCLGAITAEFFKDKFSTADSITTTTKTSETKKEGN